MRRVRHNYLPKCRRDSDPSRNMPWATGKTPMTPSSKNSPGAAAVILISYALMPSGSLAEMLGQRLVAAKAQHPFADCIRRGSLEDC